MSGRAEGVAGGEGSLEVFEGKAGTGGEDPSVEQAGVQQGFGGAPMGEGEEGVGAGEEKELGARREGGAETGCGTVVAMISLRRKPHGQAANF